MSPRHSLAAVATAAALLVAAAPASAGAPEPRAIGAAGNAGHVHMDADASGRALLAWSGISGEGYAARWADVGTDGLPIAGARGRLRTGADAFVEDVAVAPNGAAAICVLDGAGPTDVVVHRRAAGASTFEAFLVETVHGDTNGLTCDVSERGDVVVAWQQGLPFAVRAAAVPASGDAEAPRLLGRRGETPYVAMAPDGRAVIASASRGPDQRRNWIVERSAEGAWSAQRTVRVGDEGGWGPRVAVDGTGRTLVTWASSYGIRVAVGPGLDVAPLYGIAGDGLGPIVAAEPAGTVLLAWYTDVTGQASEGARLHVLTWSPGSPFPTRSHVLGRMDAYPLEASIAADGSGGVVWLRQRGDRHVLVGRARDAAGRWGPLRRLAHGHDLDFHATGVAARPGGGVTVAWHREDADRQGKGRVWVASVDP